MPIKRTDNAELRTRYEDLAGIVMLISVVARRIARGLLEYSLKVEEGGNTDGEEDDGRRVKKPGRKVKQNRR